MWGWAHHAQRAIGDPGCSPRPQGWSRLRRRRAHGLRLLPAPAGMAPGWGPCGRGRVQRPSSCCSLRLRGWSRQRHEALGPHLLLLAPAAEQPLTNIFTALLAPPPAPATRRTTDMRKPWVGLRVRHSPSSTAVVIVR
ncbi:hypothetical protein D7231_32265 [Streptomyces klenkii]|uniref:Uncharacterized protein n=1 Tax=Streptomyces klenkii TaxID=1420899 RepID=A0A3B0AK75_9ACTN|nr:hypothetical protein D7231_32265 [Streptomyces klenkii]